MISSDTILLLFSSYRTRPTSLDSKQGKSGESVTVATNYFSLVSKPGFQLLQYRVDFAPDIQDTRTKKALLYEHKAKLPKFIFDGSLLFSPHRLTTDDSPISLSSTLKNEKKEEISIKIRKVGEVQPSDFH